MKPIVLGLLVGGGTFALVLALVAHARRTALKRRVAAYVEAVTRPAGDAPRAPSLRERLAALLEPAERRLSAARLWSVLELRVVRAGVGLRPVELVFGTLAAGLALGVLGAVFTGSAGSLLIAPLACVAAVWLLLSARAQRRLRAFDAQLPEVLSALAATLRAGHSLNQAFAALAEDVEAPAGDEFRRVLAETRLGRPLDEALAALGERVPSADLDFALTAIAIQRQVGGSLSGLFETVGETVRSRQQFARKLRALTANGRASSYVLIALPVGVGLLLTLLNGSYMAVLYGSSLGRGLLIGAALSMGLGAVVIRKIVSIEG